MSRTPPVIVWFRQDLRLGDNPALVAAAEHDQEILPVYILDDASAGDWAMGAASRWWLHQSLRSLDDQLGGSLCCYSGAADRLVPQIANRVGATAVWVNRCVEPQQVACDSRVEAALAHDGVDFYSCQGSSLFDPDHVLKADGTPYRVFTPFYRRGCLGAKDPPRAPLPTKELRLTRDPAADTAIGDLGLMPAIEWYGQMESEWQVGEAGALDRLDAFLADGIVGYKEERNRPDRDKVSRLSPHLHFGEISPHQVWHAVLPLLTDAGLAADADTFLSELGWREFSRYLLWHWPSLPDSNLQSKFDRFPWMASDAALIRWQQGQTGYPIVDAGMRELWQTGYMHNRVRMIVGSFLVKNLLQDWRAGERWFWDTLVDADLANNSASWQWVAGSGADAAPYFRIFNPVLQGQKFDPSGHYVRKYVPELAGLPEATVHAPWTATTALSSPYPEPIVELKASRDRALAAYRLLSG